MDSCSPCFREDENDKMDENTEFPFSPLPVFTRTGFVGTGMTKKILDSRLHANDKRDRITKEIGMI